MKLDISYFCVALLLVFNTGSHTQPDCPSPQFLELGSTGIITCSFEGFSLLYWYSSEDVLHDDAIIMLQDSVKSGKGFDSGEYDVYLNGSLVIYNVSISHERTFTVFTFDAKATVPNRFDVEVVIQAKAFSYHPEIARCENDSDICLQKWDQNREVACYVRDARSAITLSWKIRTIEGDKNVSYHSSVTNRTFFYTTVVTTNDPFAYSSFLTLLVCKADSPQGLLEKEESLVMLHNGLSNYTNAEYTSVHLEIGSKLVLNCSDIQTSYLLWRFRDRLGDNFENILSAYLTDEPFVHAYKEDYFLEGAGTLVVGDIRVHHDGTYNCVASNGLREGVITYDVVVFANPSPDYLIVEGCSNRQYCVLEVENEGVLSCSVRKIRPRVQLEMRAFYDYFQGKIHFFDQQTFVTDNGDDYDVSLRSKYRLKDDTTDRMTIECKAIGDFPHRLDLTTKFDMLVLNGYPSEETVHHTDVTQSEGNHVWIIITLIVLGIIFVFLVSGGVLFVKVYHRKKKEKKRRIARNQTLNDATTVRRHDASREIKERKSSSLQDISEEEVIPMIAKDSLRDKEKKFIGELKLKYEVLYDAVQPIPYIRDRLYCVDRVFVEGGIEYLVTMETIGHGSWDDLQTYQNIFNDARVRSTRRILEGEPGYGKSTLALQLAYDWCNKVDASALSKVDIFILLRLRQLGGVKSIYRAIKQFLLPKDSRLSDADVETIIRNSSSVVVVLDGFDEYPDQDSGNDSHVIDIIMKKMFQQFEVILTTRSSFLPKDYPPQTKRIKLTGFDDRAREQYIRKAVVGDDLEAADKIKRKLKDNAVLAGLCQVPLFFVMFAHMSHESEHFQKFNSVTSFFRYMISCFHSHMKNKMKDENVRKFELFETDHKDLDKIAFEGLSGKDQQIVWTKKQLCKRLGQDFYNQYVSIGILVEEEILAIADQPGAPITEHVQYQTEVRFYHKLFCEWYAAHYLAEYAAKDDVTFNVISPPPLSIHISLDVSSNTWNTDPVLKNLDPIDVQFFYRFACGLNPTAGEKIISYLKKSKEGEQFAILCLLEQEGNVENLLETVRQLCSSKVIIESKHNLLLQRSTIQLLEIAASNEILISSVMLWDSFQSVDLKEESICLSSGLQIPRLDTLQELVIWQFGDLRDRTRGILDYSARCAALKTLKFGFEYVFTRFDDILLPQSFEDRDVLASLYRKNTKVTWWCYTGRLGTWTLNLKTGKWENEDGKVMTDEEYTYMARRFDVYDDFN